MAYQQPRVPEAQGRSMTAWAQETVRFLKGFCAAAWNADRQKDREIEAMKRRLEALESAAQGETRTT